MTARVHAMHSIGLVAYATPLAKIRLMHQWLLWGTRAWAMPYKAISRQRGSDNITLGPVKPACGSTRP